MILISCLPSFAHDFYHNGFFYNLLGNNEVEVTYWGISCDEYEDEYQGDISIPPIINYSGTEYNVTSIGERAFYNCPSLKSIEIPNSITRVGEWAFYKCSSLTNIEIPNSVTNIDRYAFDSCSSLTSIIVPNSITSISEGVFSSCFSLTSAEIPNSVTNIGSHAFSYSGLISIKIPNSVTSIGEGAFNCCHMRTITIPNSVKTIENSAFYDCESLTSVTIGNGIKSIGRAAFESCSSLKSITCYALIPPTISFNTFPNDDASVYVPINSIEPYGLAEYWREFKNFIYINDESISHEVGKYFDRGGLNFIITKKEQEVAIVDGTSAGIKYSGDIVIPSTIDYDGVTYSVTSIKISAFYGCNSLKSIKIPNSVSKIGEKAFCDCENLASIEISNSITSIESWTFDNCKSLTSVEIPDSVTSIGSYAFNGCESLTSINIPNSVTSIGIYAFNGCESLTSINIPNSVTDINKRAFYDCSSLVEVICLASIPPTISSNTFQKYDAKLFVPIGCKAAYESANLWKNFTEVIELTPITSITLDKTEADMTIGETISLSVTILPEIATYKYIVWKSSDSSIATVDANGKVTAVNAGEATITATTADGSNLSTTCKITVKILAKSITLNKSTASLKISESITLTASILPSTTTNKSVTWKSSNSSVATVDTNGKVTAIGIGNAIITAKTMDGSNLSASCIVAVSTTLAESISLNMTTANLNVSESITLTASVLPSTTTNKSVTWESSNSSVATVDANGKVTAINGGEAIITATTADGSNLSASCKITVKSLAKSITLNKSTASLKVSESITLTASVLPSTTTNKSVTWESSNSSVAAVDTNGKVTAISIGNAIITATTVDGSNLSASCKITVTKTLAESISLNMTTASLNVSESVTLTASVLPSTTTNKSVTWESSNSSVATVNANGKVTAIGVGKAIITAATTDGSNISAVCNVSVSGLGDVNNDAAINITDVMTVASYILGLNPNIFIFNAADINKDSKISITDIVAIVNIILNDETTNEISLHTKSVRQQALGNSFFIDDCSIQKGETKTIAINLTNVIAFSGFQVDINLPKGLEVCKKNGENMISLSDRKGFDHVLTSTLRSDGSIRLLSYSMSLMNYAGTDGALVYLTVKASDNFVGDYEICINNIKFIQTDLTEHSLEPTTCYLTSTTGIEDISGNVIVSTVGDNIVVKNVPLGSNVQVYSANGVLLKSETATDGNIVFGIPIKGVYIVTINCKSFKVMVK